VQEQAVDRVADWVRHRDERKQHLSRRLDVGHSDDAEDHDSLSPQWRKTATVNHIHFKVCEALQGARVYGWVYALEDGSELVGLGKAGRKEPKPASGSLPSLALFAEVKDFQDAYRPGVQFRIFAPVCVTIEQTVWGTNTRPFCYAAQEAETYNSNNV
jgi:hypothetical protein